MRILLLFALAAFVLFGVLPDRAMAMPNGQGADCLTCEMDHDAVAAHETCPHMTGCGLAMLPDMPRLLGVILVAGNVLVVPGAVTMRDNSPPCDLPPPRS